MKNFEEKKKNQRGTAGGTLLWKIKKKKKKNFDFFSFFFFVFNLPMEKKK